MQIYKLKQKTDKMKKKANEVLYEHAHEVMGVVQIQSSCAAVSDFTTKNCSAGPRELGEKGKSASLIWQHAAKPSLQNTLQL